MNQKPSILLIDDSEITVDGLKAYLDQKYEVLTAYNGLEGLKVFEENEKQPDLVITDLVMPGMSGVGVISRVKEKSPRTPIIAMTAWGEHPRAMAINAKADMVLEKPFELENLDRSVSKLLAATQQ